ncbi:protein-(glutamine-N5) methyltransferase, release factor-specific [Ammoniphilus oxalaticus]|uniref:Release factor glutamine methyltransferase n=2 Tax=Ammoniphilus oxalaticus TaxID=66863 RepID=A0A419SH34_9BACL|nr:protein-(glutamine-N5) methyltransferase, release factor-specific [Ammoniphilus oxalaticus]
MWKVCNMSSLTVREALQRASSFLSEIEDGSFLAELIIRHVLGWTRTDFFMRIDERLTVEQWTEIEQLTRKRQAGIPLQYLIGEQEFYGLPFKVDASVLIPRPDTEILVEQVLKLRDPEKPSVVADIGTGSGAIAVTLATHSVWRLYAVDIAADSLRLAEENSRINDVADRITFLRGDLLTPLPEKVDILVSNPPYIPSRDIEQLDVQVRNHEPLRALDGGLDGLDFYRRLCAGISEAVKPGGLIAFEVGMGQARQVEQLLLDTGCIEQTLVVCDLAGIERVVIGTKV